MILLHKSVILQKNAAKNILKGKIPQILQCKNGTKDFLKMLALTEIRRYISAKMRKSDFKNYWQKEKEKTPSSVSGNIN